MVSEPRSGSGGADERGRRRMREGGMGPRRTRDGEQQARLPNHAPAPGKREEGQRLHWGRGMEIEGAAAETSGRGGRMGSSGVGVDLR
jgi:hypothetical protein